MFQICETYSISFLERYEKLSAVFLDVNSDGVFASIGL